jgi:hypothetical protein
MDVTGLKCADLVDAMGRMHRHRCHIREEIAREQLRAAVTAPQPGRSREWTLS